MQKKLIALAIAGLSGAAFAQSNVTIYGVMDGTFDSLSATGSTTANQNYPNRTRTNFNSSYIGFKGTEALGNGLAVAFQVETGIGDSGAGAFGNPLGVQNTSNNTWATRDTYVGLAGGFGTVALGNITGPTRALGAKMDVNAGATGIGANTGLLAKMGGGSGAGVFDQRISNAIAYISPNMGGFSAVVGYMGNGNRGLDTTAAPATANVSAWTLGLNYENGPIFVGYAYTKAKDNNANSAGSSFLFSNNTVAGLAGAASAGGAGLQDASDSRLAAKYDFGMGTVGVMWDQMKASALGVYSAAPAAWTAAAGNLKQTTWFLPVTIKAGSGNVLFQYGKANNISGDGALAPFLANTDTSAKMVEVGYEYNMSKRTTLKAIWSQITNGTNASYDYLYGVSAPQTAGYGAGVKAGADPRGLSIGLRHSF